MPEHGTSGHAFDVSAGGAIYAQKSVRDAKHEVGEWDMRAERGVVRRRRREQNVGQREPPTRFAYEELISLVMRYGTI